VPAISKLSSGDHFLALREALRRVALRVDFFFADLRFVLRLAFLVAAIGDDSYSRKRNEHVNSNHTYNR